MTKTVLVVLVVVGIAFAVVLGGGALLQDDTPPPAGSNDRKRHAADYPVPRALAGIGGLLSPVGPRLTLSQNEFRAGVTPLAITVPPADDTFRTARFRVPRPFCRTAKIIYTSLFDEGHEAGLNRQEWEADKQAEDSGSCTGSLVILRTGGKLTFQCPAACTIRLE